MNEAEDLMALHLEELGLHYDRQYAYAPDRKFRADFAAWTPPYHPRNPEETKEHHYRFALIEIQGGIYNRKAHGSIQGVLRDNERLWEAFKAGWHMIRWTPDQVKDGTAKAAIEEILGGKLGG